MLDKNVIQVLFEIDDICLIFLFLYLFLFDSDLVRHVSYHDDDFVLAIKLDDILFQNNRTVTLGLV